MYESWLTWTLERSTHSMIFEGGGVAGIGVVAKDRTIAGRSKMILRRAVENMERFFIYLYPEYFE